MDLNLQNPYDVIEESELDYSFCTKDGIIYRAYFLSASHLHDSFTDAYSFSIEPVGDSEDTIHPIDVRISVTIASILTVRVINGFFLVTLVIWMKMATFSLLVEKRE